MFMTLPRVTGGSSSMSSTDDVDDDLVLGGACIRWGCACFLLLSCWGLSSEVDSSDLFVDGGSLLVGSLRVGVDCSRCDVVVVVFGAVEVVVFGAVEVVVFGAVEVVVFGAVEVVVFGAVEVVVFGAVEAVVEVLFCGLDDVVSVVVVGVSAEGGEEVLLMHWLA